ncbi:MAG: TFIIH complex serine/threonine-protein kinase subunit kin28 [Cirrosporium novae-zelandiae]|nr:MAG: TFIIH complex serine/threonine-protein kinase subunit kin28 [Cirrosporium novae-zelandiae]
MAVSPLPIRSPATIAAATAPKAKGQVAAIKQEAAANGTPNAEGRPVNDLAEQLNEETKRKYKKGKKLGEGTYAIVYLGHVISDPSKLVAIKKIKVQTEYRDGLSMDAIREVKFLQELSHPNIIALHAVYSSKNQNLNLVLEYLPLGDLEMLIKDVDGVRYGTPDIKAWMGMLCRAVWFCHSNFVLHRDIKPNNLLIAADGEVKLADFGLARSFSEPYRVMTHQVITRWYRPPELLFGARYYSGAVDIWSTGLVFAELILRTPFIAGNSDMHQLELICQAIGTPTEENWPGVSTLPDFIDFAADTSKSTYTPIRGRDFYMATFGTAGPLGVDVLMSMLTLDPRKRATATQVLQHSWWTSEPKPTRKENLPRKRAEKKMGEDLKRRGGEVEEDRGGRSDKIARRLDFSAMAKK